jgi:hypothetical protein
MMVNTRDFSQRKIPSCNIEKMCYIVVTGKFGKTCIGGVRGKIVVSLGKFRKVTLIICFLKQNTVTY